MSTTIKKKGKEIFQTLGLDQAGSVNKRPKRKRFVVLIVLLLLLVLWGLSRNNPKRMVEYSTVKVTRGDLTVIVTATGNLAPTNKVDVGCEISGIVKSVDVDFNDRVEIGQLLARLDDTKFEAAVTESKAAMASARARLQQAQATAQLKEQNLKRLRQAHKLSGGKAPSLGELELADADVQRSEADVAAANAAIDQAQARLTIDEANLSKTNIYSPINGIVLRRNVDPGQTVAASLQAPVLFTLAEDLRSMELQVDVDEADVGLVQEGQTATFTVEAHSGRTFTAKIAQLRYGSQITNGVVTYTTLLKVDNRDLLLRPGMTAMAKIVARSITDAILVPNAALRFTPPKVEDKGRKGGLFGMMFGRPDSEASPENGEQRVKIGWSQVWLLKGGKPVAVSIKPGPTDGSHTVVTEGDLQPGMSLITDAKYGS